MSKMCLYWNLLFGVVVIASNINLVAHALFFRDEFPKAERARYDNYRLYTVKLETEEQIKIVQEMTKLNSYIFFGSPRRTDLPISILVSAHKRPEFKDLAETYNLNRRLLSANFQEEIDRNQREVKSEIIPARFMNWRHFYHLKTIYEWLQLKAIEFPERVSVLDIGNSIEGVPIKGVKISDGDSQANNKTTVFIEGGVHSSEWMIPAIATYLIDQLLSSNEDNIEKLASAFNWIIFPSLNPDGYKYSIEHNRLWRKNRATSRTCRGVDLNRNFPEYWNVTGENNDPCRFSYRGPSPGSEVETQLLMKFLEENAEKERIQTYFSLHSYGQLLLFPYGHSPERVENYDDLLDIGRLAADRIKEINGREYRYGNMYELVFPLGGVSVDWVFSNLHVPIAYRLQLRPALDSDSLIVPGKDIVPTAKEAIGAIEVILQEAKKRNLYP